MQVSQSIFFRSDCIKIEDEYLVDLTDAINKQTLFCLNEASPDSGKTVFKRREDMTNRIEFVKSNDDDPELLFYIPFNSMVNIKSMTMIGGENGTSPLHAKIYVNEDNPDFSLMETNQCTQEFECIENPEGELSYELKPSKFKSITSLTLIITRAIDSNFSKIFYIGFTGTRTKVRFIYNNKICIEEAYGNAGNL